MNGDAELVHSILHGNKDDFDKLVQRYSNIVYGTAYNKLSDFHLAEDIAQEVFLKAYLHIDSLKEPDKVGNWLYSITVTTCIDWLRKNKNTLLDIEGLETSASNEITEERVLQNELRSETWKVLNSLPASSKLITILYYMSGYKAKDIAEILNLTVAAVESRLHRIKQKLRKEMLSMVADDLGSKKLGEEFQGRVREFLLHIYFKLWEQGRQQEALSVLHQSLKEDPNNLELQNALGFYSYEMYKLTKDQAFHDESQKIYEAMADQHPMGRHALADFYLREHEFSKAVEIRRTLEEKYLSGDYINFNKLALAYSLKKNGDYEEASKLLQGAVLSHYNYLIISLQHLAIQSKEEGNIELQKVYYEKVIAVIEAIGADCIKSIYIHFAYLEYGTLLTELGEVDKALDIHLASLKTFRVALLEDPPKAFDKVPAYFYYPENPNSTYFQMSILRTHMDYFERLLKSLRKDEFKNYCEDPRYLSLLREAEASLNNYTNEYSKLRKKVTKK